MSRESSRFPHPLLLLRQALFMIMVMTMMMTMMRRRWWQWWLRWRWRWWWHGSWYAGTYDICWIETVGGQLWPLHNMDSYIISLYYALLGYQRRTNINKCWGSYWRFPQGFWPYFWSFCCNQMALYPHWFCPSRLSPANLCHVSLNPPLHPYFVPALVFLGLISLCWPTGVRACKPGAQERRSI